MSGRRPWRTVLLIALACGYLGVMYSAGERDEWLAPARAAQGIVTIPEAALAEVRIATAAGGSRFRQHDGHWHDAAGHALAAPHAAQLRAALRYLTAAPPVRVLAPEAIAGVAPAAFGLDPAALTITLIQHDGHEQEIALGAQAPDTILRYARVAGEPAVVLLSGFVGDAWNALVEPTSRE